MSFEGFTEDDIIKLKNKQRTTNADTNKCQNKIKKVTFVNNSISMVKAVKETKEEVLATNSKFHTNDVAIGENNMASETPPSPNNNNCIKNISTNVEKPSKDLEPSSNTSESTQDNKRKILDLDEFQTRQKFMEEQNRKRKELLAKALEDRTKQTQEEAWRLHQIKTEFKRLDAILSNDVKVLRKEIEVASVDYMEAQKKYNKAEKEFLEAKLAIQQKLEKKEMLTEHLCTIIEKNEERKAEKLMELLEKLKMDPMNTPEDCSKKLEADENQVSSIGDVAENSK